jgi:hypothetical protein
VQIFLGKNACFLKILTRSKKRAMGENLQRLPALLWPLKPGVMFRSSNFPIGVTTLVLFIFALFGPFFSYAAAWTVFSLSPFLVIWMVVSVLKDKSHPVPELEAGDEWGYADRPDLHPVW